MLGEGACLTAAMLWAVAVVMFRAPIAAWGPRTTNLVKCLVATVLLVFTLPFFGWLSAFAAVPSRDLAWIAISGLVGLTLGDTALFAAVGKIGAHRTLVLQTSAPIFAGLLAFAMGEQLSARQLAGAAVVLAGVMLVVGPGDPHRDGRTRHAAAAGIALAVLGAVGQGAGVVLAKQGMDVIGAMPATLIRLAAGTVGLLLAGFVTGRTGTLHRAIADRPSMRRAIPATVLGTYLALLLMMFGVALAPATIAAVLLATSPIFSLVVEALVDRQRPTAAAVLGTLIAVAGVAILVSK
jgi:drug/metabolite transporter (DMT)-like permease